ncbi:hypothetical protein ACFY93_33970 [Streptomyces sp. NPDC008313]|uniref:hypothetical protein n=1 Tax=Streptomyces sp. NPDC008313 TaxID=3364826 RepID=UPI0036EBFB06
MESGISTRDGRLTADHHEIEGRVVTHIPARAPHAGPQAERGADTESNIVRGED